MHHLLVDPRDPVTVRFSIQLKQVVGELLLLDWILIRDHLHHNWLDEKVSLNDARLKRAVLSVLLRTLLKHWHQMVVCWRMLL